MVLQLDRLKSKKLLFIPAILGGILIFILLTWFSDKPQKFPPQEKPFQVRTITVPSVNLVPRALAYGNVQPSTVWNAVSEVAGQVVEKHPHLKKGALIQKGEVLIQIDPTNYELALAQNKANIHNVEAQLNELAVKQGNTKASLEIEKRSLALAQKEFERLKALERRKVGSQQAVEKQERTVLSQRQAVQNLQNTLNLMPSQRELLFAQLEVHKAQQESARLDLKRTTIVMPFDGLIAEVHAEQYQFVPQGQALLVADSIDIAEISAQLSLDKGRPLLSLPSENTQSSPSPFTIPGPQGLGISAVVRLRTSMENVEWPAELIRVSDAVDPQAHTIGIIVAVEDPYRQAIPGIRPPLFKNLFVEVELRGTSHPNSLVVPRSALHGAQVYLVNSENRLARKTVEIDFIQTNFAVIKKGLTAGEKVVVSSLPTAIEGMLLAATADVALQEALVAEAESRGGVK